MPVGLRELLGGRTLEDFVERWRPVALTASEKSELQIPPQDFIDFTLGLKPTPFDINCEGANHLKPASFFVSQVHKTWVTAGRAASLLPETGVFVDVGSFPFATPIALRKYFGFEGRIISTIVQTLDDESSDILSSLNVELAEVDLDPHVTDLSISGLECRIPLEDNSADVVLLSHVIEHLYHPMNILREINRVLKPNGSIIIATDNGTSVNLLVNVISGCDYVHEPVTSTAAMQIHQWRGHVRFFTSSDIKTMLDASGFADVEEGFVHFFFDAFSREHYRDPEPRVAEWQLNLVLNHPSYRNDLLITAKKPVH